MNISELSRQEQKERLTRLVDGAAAEDISEPELEKLAEAELSRAEAGGDMEIVAMCDELLCRTHDVSYKQVMESNRESFRRGLRMRLRAQRLSAGGMRSYVVRLTATAAVMILCATMAETIALVWKTKIHQTSDGEQLIVEPEKVGESIIATSEADCEIEQCWELDDVDEAYEKLGYRFSLPYWLPDDVTLKDIDGEQNSNFDIVSFRYVSTDDKLIIIDYYRFNDAKESSIAHEQNEGGRTISLTSGRPAYVAQNMEVIWGMVSHINGFYQVSCRGYDEETLLKILDTIGE